MNNSLYAYILFNAQLVQSYFRFRAPVQADGYLSETLGGEAAAIQAALRKGYRWVRTEGSFAIFEKAVPQPLLDASSMPSQKMNAPTSNK